jgi:predicted amino acid dehydrogenase
MAGTAALKGFLSIVFDFNAKKDSRNPETTKNGFSTVL